MTMVRCPTCNKKIDTSFYGACLDCGTMLPIEGQEQPAPVVMPSPEPAPIAPSQPESAQELPAPGQPSGPAGLGVLSRIGGGLLIRLVLVGLFVAGGAIWGVLTNADRDSRGAIVESGTLDADDLQVGDCLDWPGSGDGVELFDSVRARPCSEPHDMEVYAVLEYPSVSGTAYPGDQLLTDWGFDKCFGGFQQYIGASYQSVPDIDITIFWPSEEAWDQDDRTVHCLMIAYEDGVKLTGSLLGREA
ncbi:MAG: septum formation family protein [Acidimicrobiia bacterium]|nr:septum formation family protein [Acidimicrobiia bacterium]